MSSSPGKAGRNGRGNLPVRGADRKPARVRPYSLTGGRTRFGVLLRNGFRLAPGQAPREFQRRFSGLRGFIDVRGSLNEWQAKPLEQFRPGGAAGGENEVTNDWFCGH